MTVVYAMALGMQKKACTADHVNRVSSNIDLVSVGPQVVDISTHNHHVTPQQAMLRHYYDKYCAVPRCRTS